MGQVIEHLPRPESKPCTAKKKKKETKEGREGGRKREREKEKERKYILKKHQLNNDVKDHLY
jgi:hypothetical protein